MSGGAQKNHRKYRKKEKKKMARNKLAYEARHMKKSNGKIS
jgi:hypothetical protein